MCPGRLVWTFWIQSFRSPNYAQGPYRKTPYHSQVPYRLPSDVAERRILVAHNSKVSISCYVQLRLTNHQLTLSSSDNGIASRMSIESSSSAAGARNRISRTRTGLHIPWWLLKLTGVLIVAGLLFSSHEISARSRGHVEQDHY
ncbi:hypothetical protein BDR03DRAFT_958685 [Suillus americanus]|nr:hypothetical protein BDR03DRAFT_958685 [Suillus americanus]